MELLPFGNLPAYKPRAFVPSDMKIERWETIAPVFDQLESCLDDCSSASDLEGWLLKVSEFGAILDEEGSRRYIAMTCHSSAQGVS